MKSRSFTEKGKTNGHRLTHKKRTNLAIANKFLEYWALETVNRNRFRYQVIETGNGRKNVRNEAAPRLENSTY